MKNFFNLVTKVPKFLPQIPKFQFRTSSIYYNRKLDIGEASAVLLKKI